MANAKELVEQMIGILPHISWENGTCCCGEDMSRHSDPMSSGHTPVDMGVYAVQQWIDHAEAYLKAN